MVEQKMTDSLEMEVTMSSNLGQALTLQLLVGVEISSQVALETTCSMEKR